MPAGASNARVAGRPPSSTTWRAQAQYAAGVRTAERSLAEGFGGVLGWRWIDNRPFLRCLHGLTLTTWRLHQQDEAEALCRAMLWLS